MMIKNVLTSYIFALTLCCAIGASAQVPADSTLYLDFQKDTTQVADCVGCIPDLKYKLGFFANAGNSELAPYYISSNCGGTTTQQYSALVYAAAKLWNGSMHKRFSWGAGLEVWGGYASSAGYQRYAGNGQFEVQKQHPARIWIQEAYLAANYRSIFAVAGQARKASPIVNGKLSSGDLVWSNNARPPVGLRAGFIDFQNIPFTKGWVQIQGEFGYFRELDDKWLENHYNYYNHFITTGKWLHYKSLHLRTKPSQPVVFTIGAQSSCQFGGTADYYWDGQVERTVKMDADAKAFWRTFIAGSGGNSAGDSFVEGNHLGTWDIALRYNLSDYQHLRPNDHPGTPIISHSSGADDYYNNYIYNGYQSRGMSIGSPFVKSPLYNQDGYMRYRDNVLRGFHAAMSGWLHEDWSYRLMGSYRKAWGTPLLPRVGSVDDFSMALSVYYYPYWLKGVKVEGLSLGATVAMDRGKLYGNNWGAQLGISYSGNFNFKKR